MYTSGALARQGPVRPTRAAIEHVEHVVDEDVTYVPKDGLVVLGRGAKMDVLQQRLQSPQHGTGVSPNGVGSRQISVPLGEASSPQDRNATPRDNSPATGREGQDRGQRTVGRYAR